MIMDAFMSESADLQALLDCTPKRPTVMQNHCAQGVFRKDYKQTVDTFLQIFAFARGDVKPSVVETTACSLEPVHAFCALESGFFGEVISNRFDEVEAREVAHKMALQREAEACQHLIMLLQNQGFVQGIRTAHAEARLSMVRRGYDDTRLLDDMDKHVWMPELKGRGLPEILRKVVERGALAVAVWCAVVDSIPVEVCWNTVLDAGSEIADARREDEDFKQQSDRETNIKVKSKEIEQLKTRLAMLQTSLDVLKSGGK